MYNFNQHIKKQLLNEYSGSEKKRTIVLDDGKKYLLKMPDPTRTKGKELSYINNSISEYIGCKIFKSLDIPVQNVILGEYTEKSGKTKIACACQDIREPGETMHPVQIVNLGSDDDLTYAETSMENVEKFAKTIGLIPEKKVLDFYYDMFVTDAFIGNTDRHNGNWAILTDEDGNARLSPVYDCGSSMSPLLSDDELTEKTLLNDINNTFSAVLDENKKRINYKEYLLSGKNKNLNEAIKRLVPKINVPEILNIVSSVECISSKRKTYYSNLLKGRYEQILIPALENALNKERLAKQETKEFSVEDQKDFYKKVIQPIKEAANYKSYDLQYNNVSFKIKKISDNKVLLNDSNDQLLGVLKLGNNRTDICHFISALNNQLEKSFSKQKSFPSSIGDNDFER